VIVQAPPPIVSFAHLPAGWHQIATGPDAVAVNWRYRPNSGGWASSMPRGGIAVWVLFPAGGPRYPPLKLVLPHSPATTLEGAPDTPEYHVFGRVRGWNVQIRVDIRRSHPTLGDLRIAQRVISAMRFH
jgi:hypothetical protein